MVLRNWFIGRGTSLLKPLGQFWRPRNLRRGPGLVKRLYNLEEIHAGGKGGTKL